MPAWSGIQKTLIKLDSGPQTAGMTDETPEFMDKLWLSYAFLSPVALYTPALFLIIFVFMQ
jgi:hypothetical protein